LLGQLQGDVVQGDDIVFAHGALFLFAEDGVQIHAVQGHEGARGIGGRPRELVIVVGDEPLGQVGIGGGQGGDPREVEFVDEAPLHGPIEALAAAAGLRGIGADVLDTEAVERPADLGAMGAIHGAAGLGGVKGPMGAVGIERDGQAPGGTDGMQGREHGRRGLAGPELGVEQARGRIVDDGDEDLALVRAAAQPAMGAAIEVQQLAHARARLAAASVPAPRPPLAHEPGFLERQPHEAIRQGDAMLAPREAVEVADVPAAIAVLIESQNALHLPHRGLPARRLPATPVVQADHAVRFIPGPPPPQAAGVDPQNIGGL